MTGQPSEEALKRAFEILHKQLGHAPNMALGPLLQDIARAIDEAKREEREACAKIADGIEEEAEEAYRRSYHAHDQGMSDCAANVALAIRNRQP